MIRRLFKGTSSTHSLTTVGAYRCFPNNQPPLFSVSCLLHNFTNLQHCPLFYVIYPLFLWSASSSFSFYHPFHDHFGHSFHDHLKALLQVNLIRKDVRLPGMIQLKIISSCTENCLYVDSCIKINGAPLTKEIVRCAIKSLLIKEISEIS